MRPIRQFILPQEILPCLTFFSNRYSFPTFGVATLLGKTRNTS